MFEGHETLRMYKYFTKATKKEAGQVLIPSEQHATKIGGKYAHNKPYQSRLNIIPQTFLQSSPTRLLRLPINKHTNLSNPPLARLGSPFQSLLQAPTALHQPYLGLSHSSSVFQG